MFMYKQDYILKNFKNTGNVFDTIGLRKSTICFNINFYNLLKNYPCLKSSSLSSYHFKNNF